MTHLKMLKELLDGQAERGIKLGGWERLEYDQKYPPGGIALRIDNLQVEFVFTKKGRLLGAYNE